MVKAEDTVDGYLAFIGFVQTDGVMQRKVKPTMHIDVLQDSLDVIIYNCADLPRLEIIQPAILRLGLYGQTMPDFCDTLSKRFGFQLEHKGSIYIAKFGMRDQKFEVAIRTTLNELETGYNGEISHPFKFQ